MLSVGKKILVPIDGSPQSDKAAEEAVRLALAGESTFKSTLHAILVLPGMRAPSFTDFFPSLPATERPDWEENRKRIFYVVVLSDTAATAGGPVLAGRRRLRPRVHRAGARHADRVVGDRRGRDQRPGIGHRRDGARRRGPGLRDRTGAAHLAVPPFVTSRTS